MNRDIPHATFRVLFTDQVTLAKLTKGYNAKLFVLKGVANSITCIQSDKSIVLQSPLSPNTPVDIQFRFMYYTGTTAPTTYTPYIGQTTNLTLPRTIYGGTVDAVTGDGQETWQAKSFNGTENWALYDDGSSAKFFYTADYTVDSEPLDTICSHFRKAAFTRGTIIRVYTSVFTDLDAYKDYLTAQYAAGTPVQIAYKLATPTPFTATGAQPIPALSGVNTVITDADSVTVTGRADPIKRITDLEDAVASMTDT